MSSRVVADPIIMFNRLCGIVGVTLFECFSTSGAVKKTWRSLPKIGHAAA